MSKVISERIAQEAAEYLMAHDQLLAPIVQLVGPCTIRPHRDYYRELVDSIVSQQLSVKAAASIFQRFLDLFDGEFPSPEQILTKSTDDLRGVGFSGAKANYVRDLAQHIIDGKVTFDDLDDMTNEQIITKLTDVKGIGEWTVHMFLMFCMGRTDVLPYGDLGIRNGMQKLYNLETLPGKTEIEQIATNNNWHPYESIASWYIWQSLKNAPVL